MSRKLKKGDRYLIAEIGGNHEGNLNVALDLIRSAADTGVDAVKFQSYTGKGLVNRILDPERVIHFDRFTLEPSDFEKLKSEAKNLGLDFLSSIWDYDAYRDLIDDMPMIKIGSGDLTNRLYLERFARTGKPIILSTAMCNLDEICDAVHFIRSINDVYECADNLCIMHCVAMYGNPKDEFANLASIQKLQEVLPNVEIGYSDHTIGNEAMIFAYALGVRKFEFHFTYDKNREFRDHHISLNSQDIIDLIESFDRFDRMIGMREKKPISEIETVQRIREFRRGVFLIRDLKKGDVVELSDLTVLRPNIGIPASDYQWLIGKKATQNITAFQALDKKYFE